MRRNLRSMAFALCLLAVAVGVAAGSPLNRKISGDLPGYADVESYWNVQISPDSRYAVYASDARIDNFYDLYSVPLDGSRAPIRISDPAQYPGDSAFLSWKITADSQRVVYQNRESTLDGYQLFSVAIDGGQKTRLSPRQPTYDSVRDFDLSPNSKYVVLHTEQGLFSVPAEGGNVVQLAAVSSDQFEITADSGSVVYQQGNAVTGYADFYISDLNGGTAKRLASNVYLGQWQLYKDEAGIQRVITSAQGDDGNYTLYTLSLTDGSAERIPVTSSGPNARFSVCADGERIVYTDDRIGKGSIYSVSLATQVPITVATETFGFGGWPAPVSPDCSSIVYGKGDSFFVVPTLGGDPIKIPQFCDYRYAFTPDSGYMVYYGREREDQPCEIYSVNLPLKTSARVNPPLPAGGRMRLPRLQLPVLENRSVVYVAEQENDNVAEIFMASLDGTSFEKLNGPMTLGGNVTGVPVLSPDGRYVVYVADQERDEVHELFATALEGKAGARTYLPLVQR